MTDEFLQICLVSEPLRAGGRGWNDESSRCARPLPLCVVGGIRSPKKRKKDDGRQEATIGKSERQDDGEEGWIAQ